MKENYEDILAQVLERARAEGAETADALVYGSVSQSVSVRLGEVEEIERAESRDLGLRVLIGHRQASVSTNDFSKAAIADIAERAVAMAKLAPEDPYCGLVPAAELAKGPFPDLDLFDGIDPSADELKARALACEDAARGVEGVTNSGGAGASVGYGQTWFATTEGFAGTTTGGRHSLSVSVVAGSGAAMERDYDYDSATHLEDVRDAREIGITAGERAVRRLGPEKLTSRRAPVLFDRRLSTTLIGPLASAINGAAIARGTSFLKDRMGEQLFPADVTITDDPHLPRGFGSRHFDGEGRHPEAIDVIAEGRLRSWILNSAQARQLGLESNARARRGTGGPPSSGTTNFDLGPGSMSVEDLYRDTGEGLLVTDMFGPQINGNTGDYSVGCSGFWIENGKVGTPVSEITIAGNLLDMWKDLVRADDFVRRGASNAPTCRVAEMTIAGN